MTTAIDPARLSNPPYRILFVDHAAVLGGAELSLLDLAIAYRQTSRVLLFAEGPFRQCLEASGVSVCVIEAAETLLEARASGGLGALKAFPALWYLARQVLKQSQGFEIIHANSQKSFFVAALARWMGGPPVVWHLRDILSASHFSTLNRYLAIVLANVYASRVIVNSHATGQAFVAAGGNPKLVQLVYNGVSPDAFLKITAEQKAAVCLELRISSDTPLVGSFSRLSYWKGQHVLLAAIKDLPDVHVMLVGKALFGEDDYVAHLKVIADAPELAGRVHWLGFRSDIPVLMSICSVIAHTSTEPEPFGRVIVEGQLAKRPVVATAAGGAKELIEDGKTGRLVPPDDVNALRSAIEELLTSPAEAEDIAYQGYNQACTKFSLNNLLRNFSHAVGTIVSDKNCNAS